jgi:hypothetical protein
MPDCQGSLTNDFKNEARSAVWWNRRLLMKAPRGLTATQGGSFTEYWWAEQSARSDPR